MIHTNSFAASRKFVFQSNDLPNKIKESAKNKIWIQMQSQIAWIHLNRKYETNFNLNVRQQNFLAKKGQFTVFYLVLWFSATVRSFQIKKKKRKRTNFRRCFFFCVCVRYMISVNEWFFCSHYFEANHTILLARIQTNAKMAISTTRFWLRWLNLFVAVYKKSSPTLMAFGSATFSLCKSFCFSSVTHFALHLWFSLSLSVSLSFSLFYLILCAVLLCVLLARSNSSRYLVVSNDSKRMNKYEKCHFRWQKKTPQKRHTYIYI